MKNKHFFIKIMLAIIVGGFLLPTQLLAQTSPSPGAVLNLKKNKFNSYFSTGVNFSDLLNQGQAKQATVEFWIKSTGAGNEWVLTDLLTDNESFSMRVVNNHLLKVKVKNIEKTIDLSGVVGKDTWHHVALTTNATTTTIYVNGRTRGVFSDLNFTTAQARQLYFYKAKQAELFITEVRAWNNTRTKQLIDRNWAKIFRTEELGQQVAQGLNLLLNTTSQNTTKDTKLSSLEWANAVTSSTVKFAKGVSRYGETTRIGDQLFYFDYTLATVSTTVGHPILTLEKIIVDGSKGQFTDKVQLTWNHIQKAKAYTVSRRTQAGATFVTLPNPPAIDTKKPGDNVVFEDKDLAAGERYVYKVEASGDNNFKTNGTTLGFIFYNGQISGQVATNRKDPVQDVEITATLKAGGVQGQALSFTAQSTPVVVDNIEALRNQPRLTIEFWYKGNNDNTVFALGNSKISFTGSKLMVTNADNTAYIEGTLKTQNNDWHHYAFTFTPVLDKDNKPVGALGKLYQDGEEISTTAKAYQAPAGHVNRFTIGAVNQGAYQLDEFKVWKLAKTAKQIKQTYRHVISGEEDNLLLYYRFDEGSGTEVYNYALANRNDYIGKSNKIEWVTSQHSGLYYGTLTSTTGAYVLKGLNYGTSGTGKTFNVVPKKPNHNFKPATIEVLLQRGVAIAKSEVNFTDVSQFSISGRILYKEGDDVYPVAQGQQILLKNDNNVEIFAPGDKAKTDATGQFVTSASPERLRIKVSAPQLKRTNLANKSLRFNGKDAYAQAEGTIVHKGNTTWSFWLKPAAPDEKFEGEATSGTTSAPVPQNQTVFAIGNIHLNLEAGETLVLKKGSTELVRSTQKIGNQDLSFCAIAYDAASQKFTLYVTNTPDVSSAVANVDLSGRFALGALLESSTPTNPFRGYIDQIEYRQAALTTSDDLKSAKEGKLIASDAQSLKLFYPVVETGGTRVLSLTPNAQNNGLKLTGVQIDNKIVALTQKSYQYTYVATNQKYNPKEDAYTLNIDGVKTDLDFENTTRYGFVGNIIIPCDNNIGDLKGKIFRTDIPGFEKTFDASNFNSRKNAFTVAGLIPGKYRVEIKRKDASADAEPLLRSPVLDITQGWASYDFEYHNPLLVSFNIYEVDVMSRVINDKAEMGGKRGKIVAPLCSGNYALEPYKNYELELSVAEEYGSSKCPIPAVKYTVSGKLGTPVKGNGTTDKSGKAVVRFLSGGPSFDAKDFLEQFQISVTGGNRTAQKFVKSFIKGTQQLTSDFTIEEPEILHVLHDPPGDGSSATFAKGATISFAVNTSTEAGVEIATTFEAGTGVRILSGGGLGAIILTQTLKARNLAGVTLGFENNNTLTTQNLWTLTTEQTYTTSDSEDIVGPDADLFIGAGKVITYGGARKLVIDPTTCKASIKSIPKSVKQNYTSPFAFTAQHIKDVTIPGFDKLIKDENAKVDNGTQTRPAADKLIAGYEHKKQKWQNILDKNYQKIVTTDQNDKKIEHGFKAGLNTLDFPHKDFAFAGGGQTYTAELTWSKDNNISNEHSFIGSIGKTIEADNTLAGVRFKSKTDITGTIGTTTGTDNANGKNTGISFTLADGDQGDQFYILMRRDLDYNTPIFKTIGGRSSCPYERNTQPREGVKIETLNGNTQVTPAGTKAIYQLRLTNTQISEDATTKAYILDVEESSNTKGAKVLLNGTAIGKGRRFLLAPKASTTAELTIEQNASGDIDYKNLKINFYSECEYSLDNTFSYTPDELYQRNADGTVKKDANGNPISLVKINDHVLLNARFATPCVSKFSIRQPTTNWVVNNTSKNKLTLRFKPEQAQSDLKKVEVEYATEANNNAQLLTSLQVADLTKDSEGFYKTSVDVSGLTDGKYNVRLVPVCGEAGANRNNVSEWIEGTIQRNAPMIASVTPEPNGVLGSGEIISATYTNQISNSEVNSLNVNVMGVLANTNYTPTAAKFIESTDQIQIPDQGVLDVKSYTVEFWVQAFHPTAEVSIIDKGSNFKVALMPDGKINTGQLISSTALTPNMWTHVAVTYDEANKGHQIYFNGRLAGSKDLKLVPMPHFAVSDEPITMGKASGAQGFKGNIDEVRIWNIARTDVGIINNYRKMLLGNENNLVGYYRLDNNALTLNGAKEGIRDFTGNARGTTTTGINWITQKEAAPLAMEAVPQSVPVTVQLSNGNKILVTPTLADSDLEGSFLTVTITHNKIKDLQGNQIEGKSWSFRYKKSHISWNRRNLSIQQTWQQKQTFDLTLMNAGATRVSYALVDLPLWLKVKDKTVGQPYELNDISNEQLNFEVQPWLNPGTHTALIKAKVSDVSGRLLGVEQVLLTVNVTCASPEYVLDASKYANFMILQATLSIHGQQSIDANDKVTAFAAGSDGKPEVRGKGNVIKIGDQYLISMTIHSNALKDEALQFKVWDASDCREYGSVLENYTFTRNAILGSLAVPKTLTVGGNLLPHSFQVKSGFQFVTFAATEPGQNYLNIVRVKGLPATSTITAQDGTLATYNGTTWTGTLTQLKPTQSYQLLAAATAGGTTSTVTFEGAKVELNTSISVNAGLTWIGYLPAKTYPIGQAMASLNVGNLTAGLRLIASDGSFSLYDGTTGKWSGTLEHMIPNQGYRLLSPANGSFNYATSLGSQTSRMAFANDEKPVFEIRAEAKTMGMQTQPLKHRYATYVVGVLEKNGQRINAADYIITAHTKTGEVKGVAVPQKVNGKLMYFLTVHSHDKQTLFNVRLTNRATKEVQNLKKVIHYQNGVQGSLETPYVFDTTSEEAGAALFSRYRLYQNQPNPFHETTSIGYELPEANQVRLTVYNAQGYVVAVLVQGTRKAGKHTVQWHRKGLPAGVYFYTLTAEGIAPVTKRLVIH